MASTSLDMRRCYTGRWDQIPLKLYLEREGEENLSRPTNSSKVVGIRELGTICSCDSRAVPTAV